MFAIGAAINKRSCGMEEADRISNLPLDLTHKILECLPLEEAVKTSVLSRNWRFKWTSIPQLTIGESFITTIIKGRNEFNDRTDISLTYSTAVNNILLSHDGPITKFVLYIPFWFVGEIYTWVRYVCASDLKELTLDYFLGFQMNLPTCLFTCSSLTHLTITGCKLLYIPPTFTGFPCLVYLKLGGYYFRDSSKNNEVLETLISRCPQLKTLHLVINEEMDLTIHAPKLRNLRVRGFIYSLFLEDTRVINTVVLEIWLRNYCCLDDIFDCLANVEVLVLNDSFWLSTYHYKPPKKFPKGLGRLRTLILAYVRLYEQAHMSFVLCLLASSPRLEKLSIQVPQFAEVTDDQPVQIDCSNIFQCLRKVQLLGMLGLRSELQLIQYILAQSPVLEEMTIGLNEITSQMGSEVKYCFSLEAMLCPRASPNAEIIITTVC